MTKAQKPDLSILPSGRDDWYRNETWSQDIEDAFLYKLGRSRSSKDQHLSIQISYLDSQFPKEALRLAELFHEICGDVVGFSLQRVLLAEATAHMALMQRESALQKMYAHHNASLQGSPADQMALPYFVAVQGFTAEFEAAVRLLDEIKFDGFFLVKEQFRWRSANAVIRFKLGQCDLAREYASKALLVLDAEHSGIERHPTVGLVDTVAEAPMIKLVRRVAAGQDPWPDGGA